MPSRLNPVRPPAVPPRPTGMSAREYEAYQLVVLGEAGVERVRLRAPDAPGTPRLCRDNHGIEMTLDDAMRLRLIPHDVGADVRCRCTYRPAW